MLRTLLLSLALFFLPFPLLAQTAGATAGIGYGVTQSRLRSGDALSLQASLPAWSAGGIELRGELLYQRGRAEGRGCERLQERYCIGGSDLNQIVGVGAGLHLPLGSLRSVTVYVPLGIGAYHRSTGTTETEGPIELCVEGGQVIACPGNPPLPSIGYRSRATVAGYNAGVGLRTRIAGVGVYAETRVYDLLEKESKAGALPLMIGIQF